MIDEDFVRDLIAQPNDDVLRLVYADWLEEQGDRRSDFLRMEVALASAKPGPQRDELEKRIKDLSEGFEWCWLRAVSRTVVDKSTRIDVSDVTSIAFTFLEHLYDCCNGQKGWCSVQSMGRELGLSNNEIKDIIQHLAPLRLLERRSGSRRRKTSASISHCAVISAKGRAHVKAMLGRPSDRKTGRGFN